MMLERIFLSKDIDVLLKPRCFSRGFFFFAGFKRSPNAIKKGMK
jgi:hypothetical protein